MAAPRRLHTRHTQAADDRVEGGPGRVARWVPHTFPPAAVGNGQFAAHATLSELKASVLLGVLRHLLSVVALRPQNP